MKKVLLLFFCLLQPLFAVAQSTISHIEIIVPAENASSRELAISIQRELLKSSAGVEINVHNKENLPNTNSSSTLVIAIGDSLLPWLAANKNNYFGSIAFLANSAAIPEDDKGNKKFTAIYRDQPLARQLLLAKLLMPNLRQVAIIRGDSKLAQTVEMLQRIAQVSITETIIDLNSEWAKQLSQLMQNHDLLLGVDDQQIYNASTIRGVLLTTYRHGKSLIGPSRAFVNAGSLASCYTLPEQYTQQLVEMVEFTIREHKLPRPQYPSRFHVAINRQVATSLNIPVQDENNLSARLQDLKGECGDGC